MIEKIKKALVRKRAAVLCMERRQRDSLFVALQNQYAPTEDGILRFSFPENPDRFAMFANGAMNALATEASALYCSRYPGVLMIEIDEDGYAKTDMPMAFLELTSKLTQMRLVIICGTETLLYHMLECCSKFIVPCMIEPAEETMNSARLLESTAARLGMRFADRYTLQQSANLFDRYSALSAFHTDTFLCSLVGSEGVISSASIRSEINAVDSYIHVCDMALQKYGMRIPMRDRHIGFQSNGICSERNERSA